MRHSHLCDNVPSSVSAAAATTAHANAHLGIVRYAPVSVENAWRTNNSKHQGLETLSYRFDFSNGLSATGIWLKAISAPSDKPITIVLADEGFKSATDVVSEHINRGEEVLALDLLFNGVWLVTISSAFEISSMARCPAICYKLWHHA